MVLAYLEWTWGCEDIFLNLLKKGFLSDSNISSDYIAIFLSLISSFCGQHLKI